MTPFLLRIIKTVIYILVLWGLLFLNWWSKKHNKKTLYYISIAFILLFIGFIIWSKFGKH